MLFKYYAIIYLGYSHFLWNKTILSITPCYNYVIQLFSIYGEIFAFTGLNAIVIDQPVAHVELEVLLVWSVFMHIVVQVKRLFSPYPPKCWKVCLLLLFCSPFASCSRESCAVCGVQLAGTTYTGSIKTVTTVNLFQLLNKADSAIQSSTTQAVQTLM